MKPRSALIALAILGCGKNQVTPPAAATHDASVSEEAAAPKPLPPPRTSVRAASFESAAVLPSGKVLVTTADATLLWDPKTADAPRSVEQHGGDRGAHVAGGSTRYAIASTANGKPSVELWDAETLTRALVLEGPWPDTTDGLGAFSPDRSRFFYAGCAHPKGKEEYADCTTGAYALPDGSVIHRHQLARLAFGIYLPSFVISPAGTYFGFSHETLPNQVWETKTGKRVFEGEPDTLAFFLDDDRLFSMTTKKALVVTSMATGKKIQSADPKIPRSSFAHGMVSSPDRRYFSLIVNPAKGPKREVFVYDIAGDKLAHHVLPEGVCPMFCSAQWRSPTSLVIHAQDGTTIESQWRLDASTGIGVVEPFVRGPAYLKDGYQVLADTFIPIDAEWSRVGTKGSSEPTEPPHAVTPSGARVDLEPLGWNESAFSVQGGLLVHLKQKTLEIVYPDGKHAILAR